MIHMKKYRFCLLLLALLTLLMGCGGEKALSTESAPPVTDAQEAPVQISTAEEFLAALESGAEIHLAPGTYEIGTASGSETQTENRPFHWDPETGALWITGLKDLTIHGNGAEILLGDPEGMPLVFADCQNLRIEDLTIGHKDPKAQGKKTLLLKSCQDVTLQDLTLRDSVSTLLHLLDTTSCQMESCRFTGPSGTAFAFSGCQSVTVKNCQIENLGISQEQDRERGMPDFEALISISEWAGGSQSKESRDITVEDCTFTDNDSGLLAFVSCSRKVFFRNNCFTGNHVREAAFCFWTSAPHVVGCTFEDNDPWAWYYPYSSLAVDENGADISAEQFSPLDPLPEAGPQKEVKVTTADEFLAAIGPDTKILLNAELIDLSTASDYGKGSSPCYYWSETYDGPQLVITGVNNLTVTAEDTDCKTHTLSALPRYADVLSFEFCTNLTFSNFTAGHTVEPGYCMGGVIGLKECRKTTFQNCGLYDCGILGIIAHGGEDLLIKDCDI